MKLRQRLQQAQAAERQKAEDQRLVTSWVQGLKFEASQKRGRLALSQKQEARRRGRAKARDIFLKDQA